MSNLRDEWEEHAEDFTEPLQCRDCGEHIRLVLTGIARVKKEEYEYTYSGWFDFHEEREVVGTSERNYTSEMWACGCSYAYLDDELPDGWPVTEIDLTAEDTDA